MDTLFAIVDIETTGSHANANGITEIAIYVHNGEKIIDSYETLINPQQDIPDFIQSLTGISNVMVQHAPTFEQVAEEIYELLQDKVFVAHNVNFDYSFINHHLKKEGYTLNSKKLCTVRLARKILPGLPSYSLGKLCRSLNISVQNRHRAGGDAFATATLFKMMFDADEHGFIKEALQAKAKEEVLPPYISRLQLNSIPRQPGVYYFKDKKDKIIYVGKAKNLYKRILSHFSNNSPHKIKQDFLREIRKISHQVCGTELQAFILESVEIKRLWPEKNRALKYPEKRYALYVYEDQNGYLRLNIGRKNKHIKNEHLFNSFAEAQALVREWCSSYELCTVLCGLQKSAVGCLALADSLCKGACIGTESIYAYNQKVLSLLNGIKAEQQSYLIIDEGRNRLEKSCIVVNNGLFYGMGYVKESEIPQTIDAAKEKVVQYPSYLFIEKLISDFVLTHPEKRLILS